MLLPLPKRHRSVEENILPLINIVFLLLIFFMVAGALHTRAPFEVDPPGTENATDSNPRSDLLAVSADGRLALGGEAIDDATLADLIGREAVREAVRAGLAAHAADHGGPSQRIGRALLMEEPPSIDAGEITDKGYVNQRAVLARRSALVERLFDDADPDVVRCPGAAGASAG